ncbi:MAG TPA: hypothetical protein VNS58_30130 [Puia sp.]|nr:hypothetical protein [Puia sp.]
MRKILIFNLLFLTFRQAGYTQSFGVKTGTDMYYRLQSEAKAGQFEEKTSGIWHFTVTSSTDSGLVILCTLLCYSSETNYQLFNTADSLLCRPNSSKDVEMLCFLNRPFSYVLQKNGNTDQPGVREIFEKRIGSWQLEDSYAGSMRQNVQYYLAPEMRMLFLPDSSHTVTGHEITVTRLEPAEIKDHSPGEDFITAIVTASRSSRALFEGPTYDSAKVAGYFKHYDPLYGNLNFYKLIKLDLLMGCNMQVGFERYDAVLLQTDDSILAPYPIHLFNKAQTVKNISVDSAYQTLRYFSKQKRTFHDWIQQFFAQEFMSQAEGPIEELQAAWRKNGAPEEEIAKYTRQALNSRIISKKLLEKLANDNDTTMRDEVYPLYLWVEAKKHASNMDSVLQIAGELDKMNGSKKYGNHYRYALLL